VEAIVEASLEKFERRGPIEHLALDEMKQEPS